MKRVLLILVSCLALMGSKCSEDERVIAFEAGKKKVELDKRVLVECPELKKLTGRSEEEVLAFIEYVTTEYQACRQWKGTLNKIVKDAFNVEAP
jgi:hypothetical protein